VHEGEGDQGAHLCAPLIGARLLSGHGAPLKLEPQRSPRSAEEERANGDRRGGRESSRRSRVSPYTEDGTRLVFGFRFSVFRCGGLAGDGVECAGRALMGEPPMVAGNTSTIAFASRHLASETGQTSQPSVTEQTAFGLLSSYDYVM
jgi:hypothetical protein